MKRERELREAEQAANDLPRVVLVTIRGEIELELFENEAPNTVANFIALVEEHSSTVWHSMKLHPGSRLAPDVRWATARAAPDISLNMSLIRRIAGSIFVAVWPRSVKAGWRTAPSST